jgi:undecaprenyl pyrophosphate phosphatase UppP
VQAAETRLLYENATTGIAATVVIASLLAYAQRDVVSRFIVSAWLLYVLLVAAARFVLVRRYWRVSPSEIENGRWNAAFVVGAAMPQQVGGRARSRSTRQPEP